MYQKNERPGTRVRAWHKKNTVKLQKLREFQAEVTLPTLAVVVPEISRETEEIVMPRRAGLRLELNLADWWIGAFWRRDELRRLHIWICIIPCIPLHIQI
jgi:hypothetical protein